MRTAEGTVTSHPPAGDVPGVEEEKEVERRRESREEKGEMRQRPRTRDSVGWC